MLRADKLYCPQCREKIKEVKVIKGDIRYYVPDSSSSCFKEDDTMYGECETVVLCTHCGANITPYILLKEEL